MNARNMIAAAALVAAAPTVAAAADPTARVVVTGIGEVRAAPDMAIVSVGVETQGATAAEALTSNAASVNATLAALKKRGVSEKDIQTSNLSVSPVFDYEAKRSNPPIVGYAASNMLTVTIRDREKTGAIIDNVVAAGANRLNGLSFSFANADALEAEARRLAVKDAKARAALYADAADVKLGRLLLISESGDLGGPQPVDMRVRAMKAEATPIMAGESAVTASVTLVYEIGG